MTLAVLGVVVVASAAAIAVLVLDRDDGPSVGAQPASTTSIPPPTTSSSTTSSTTAAPSTATTSTSPSTTVAIHELSAAEISQRYGDAVWKVETEGCGFAGSGSSFALSNRHLVTNFHVVENDPTPTVRSRGGRAQEGRVVGSSYSPDVAVIEVDQDLDTVLEWGSSTDVTLGDQIVSLGYPAPAGDFTVTPGNVLSFGSEGGHRDFIRTDGQLDRGNSGGPTLADDGSVVGVVTSLEYNPTGVQTVPQIFTSDIIRPVVEAMIGTPRPMENPCESIVGDPEPSDYTDFWTAIIASLPVDEFDYDQAYDRALDFLVDTGLWSDVLLSDLYPSLNPGYWAVYSGHFASQSEAASHCDLITSLGYDCYPRHVAYYYGD